MRFAFCIFKYFPFGGAQQDCLAIAQACVKAGHHVDILTMEWRGDKPESIGVHCFAIKAWSNHRRYQLFYEKIQSHLRAHPVDGVIGFNKIPGLDVYVAVDPCLAHKMGNNFLYQKYLPRYKQLLAYEAAVFDAHLKTQIFLLTENSREDFMSHYHTPKDRFSVLPPGIQRDRLLSSDWMDIRQNLRKKMGVKDNTRILLMVGSGFKTKGLDRALKAMALLPGQLRASVQLWVAGSDNMKPFLRLAKRLGISEQLHYLGGRDDVPALLQAADGLIHPAYYEAAGKILLEAMMAGLPILTTDVCGYAPYVKQALMGTVLASPFSQDDLNGVLVDFLRDMNDDSRALYQTRAREFVEKTALFSMPEEAAHRIVAIIEGKSCH